MLPLDKLTEAAAAALVEKGISLDDITVAVRMNLGFDGSAGESWLVYEKGRDLIHRVSADPNSIQIKKEIPRDLADFKKVPDATKATLIDSLSLEYYTRLRADRCFNVERFLAKRQNTKCPEIDESLPEEKKKEIKEDWEHGGECEIIAYFTHDNGSKVSAFINVVKRLHDGEEVKEDDSVFEQFNKKCPKCGKVYEDQNRRICDNCQNRGKVLGMIWEFTKPYKWSVFTVFACMIISALLNLLSPILSGRVLIDWVISPSGKWHSVGMLFLVLFGIFGLAIVSLVLNIVMNRINAQFSTPMSIDIKKKVYDCLMHLNLDYLNQYSPGWLNARVDYDASYINSFVQNGIPNFIINAVTFVGLIVFLFILNWKLTLLVLVPIPIIVLMFRVLLPKMSRMYTIVYRASSSLNAMLSDSLNGIRVVKAFSKEVDEAHRFHQKSHKLYDVGLRVNLTSLMIYPVISLVIGLSSQLIWSVGGLSVMGLEMTYGDFSAYLGYVGMVFAPLQFFSTFSNQVTVTLNSAERIYDVIGQVPTIYEDPKAVDLSEMKGEIEFENLSFHYQPNRPILKNINLKINAGDNIGLVGHTGCGKTTLVNLISRMYDPVFGSIKIDGVDLKKIKLSSLRNNIAMVTQEVYLFRGSIMDNIRYARPDATREEVIRAAKLANAHEFIIKLFDGYDTLVGSGYSGLSGGERQRISIARALLMDPSILILDEATAAMDTETERLISDALAELVKGRTCITIAHRLSTLKDCNYLYVIENGEIAEEGAPEELLAQGGIYYKLFTLQSEAMKKVLSGM